MKEVLEKSVLQKEKMFLQFSSFVPTEKLRAYLKKKHNMK